MQGDLGVRRARYEARWHAFAASAAAAGGSTSVAYAAVPWLADQPGGDIEPLVLYGTSGAAAPPQVFAVIETQQSCGCRQPRRWPSLHPEACLSLIVC